MSDNPLPLDPRDQVNQLAGEFERAFLAGARPRIEDYLRQVSHLRPYVLRGLLALEVELRQRLGHRPTAEEYEQRFSTDGDIIASVFASHEPGSTIDHCDDNGAEEEETPARMGRYEIQNLLGRGGFGMVYLAYDPRLDRRVALKVPRRDRFKTKEQVADFLKEARTAAKLKHPSLVAVYDVQEQDGLPYIVQEYIPGHNLGTWTIRGKPSFEQIARLMAEVCAAVHYVHEQGLIHCDLKTANVLMDGEGRPHVADFGLAVPDSIQPLLKGKTFGTPAAMAPEQVRGESHLLDSRTDVWALGVMLYQLLSGRLPFVASSKEETFELIRTRDPQPLRQFDRNQGTGTDLHEVLVAASGGSLSHGKLLAGRLVGLAGTRTFHASTAICSGPC